MKARNEQSADSMKQVMDATTEEADTEPPPLVDRVETDSSSSSESDTDESDTDARPR